MKSKTKSDAEYFRKIRETVREVEKWPSWMRHSIGISAYEEVVRKERQKKVGD